VNPTRAAWWTDTLAAVRRLSRRPAFALAVVATTALGIGATIALFAIVRSVAFSGLPFANDERLVVIESRNPAKPGETKVSALDFEDLERATTGTLDGIAAYAFWGMVFQADAGGDAAPEWRSAGRVSPALFRVLGVTPALGAVFPPDSNQLGRDRRVLLGDALWRERFAADPGVIGRRVLLDGEPYEVTGVMPRGFRFPDSDDVGMWVPLAFSANERHRRSVRMFDAAVGRLAPGATRARLDAVLGELSADLAADHPGTNRDWSFVATPARERWAPAPRGLLALLAAVGLVHLIACCNLAGLLLARIMDRERELAMRTALGAGRWDLARSALAEAAVLVGSGTLAGLALAPSLLGLWQRFALVATPGWNPLRLDAGTWAFALALGLASLLVAAVVPSVWAARPRRGAAVEASPNVTAPRRRLAARRALVGMEVALALCLVAGTGLLLRSFWALRGEARGFDPRGVLAASFYLPDGPDGRYADDAAQAAFSTRFLERVTELPEVESAGLISALPFSVHGFDYDLPVVPEGSAPPRGEEPEADYRIVAGDYFAALRIPVVAGRAFAGSDDARAPRVAIVNQAFAARHFAGRDPGDAIGRTLRMYHAGGPALRIVGVVGDVRHKSLAAVPRPEFYVPLAQQQYDHGGTTLVVRVRRGEALAAAAEVRAALAAVDPQMAPAEVAAFESLVDASLRDRRAQAGLLVVFAVAGLLLAGLGTYALLAFSLASRSREFGIRQALGATLSHLRVQVLRETAWVGVVGGAAGLVAAALTASALGGMLYGVGRFDAVTLGATVAALVVTLLIAALRPLGRLANLDPSRVLRAE
jgi:putative ABC transport system permease protein